MARRLDNYPVQQVQYLFPVFRSTGLKTSVLKDAQLNPPGPGANYALDGSARTPRTCHERDLAGSLAILTPHSKATLTGMSGYHWLLRVLSHEFAHAIVAVECIRCMIYSVESC